MSEQFDPYELRARKLLLLAGLYRGKAAELDMAAEAVLATRSLRQFTEAWDKAVAQDIAGHPDLAELNVQLDGYYDEPGPT